MPNPILVGLGVGAVSTIVETVLHPIRSYISAQFAPDDYQKLRSAWWDSPVILPEPGALLDAWIREVDPEAQWTWALRLNGINVRGTGASKWDAHRYRLWNAVREAHRSVPGADLWAQWYARGWPVDPTWPNMIVRAGGSYPHWTAAAKMALARPSADLVWDGWVRGLYRDQFPDDDLRYYGGDAADYRRLASLYSEGLGTTETMAALNRGLLAEDEAQPYSFTGLMRMNHVTDPNYQGLYRELAKGVPGVADLTMMGIREAFRPELAKVYSYYDEFPELTRPWYAKLGLDYPTNVQITEGDRPRQATLADLYWASHWHPMPLGQAYLAYQRFQPDLLQRFQEDNPNLKPFTLDDLKLHMRIADLPPGVRDWMVALSHPVLGQRQIRQGMQYLKWGQGEVQARYRLLGYTSSDALVMARIAEGQEAARVNAWSDGIVRSARTRTVSEIEGMYDDGIIDRQTAVQHLSATGLPPDVPTQLLDLADAKRARALLREAVRGTGRDYLGGVLSAAEAALSLADLGIGQARVGELMQIWSIRRSRHRRQASTGQILGWVGAGRMTADEGRRRLVNLQWSDPDQLLLLADAQDRLNKLSAKEQKLVEKDAASRAKEIARLAKEAAAEQKRLLAEANRVAPRSTLTTWLKDAVIDEATFRSLMEQRGYPMEDIDRYVQDALTPKPPKPRVAPAPKVFPRPKDSAHPSLGMVEKWYLTETISASQFRDMLGDMGYGESDTDRIIYNADLKHGAKGTTVQPPSPAPP